MGYAVAMFGKGSLYHLIRIGARLTLLESLLVYSLPFVFLNSQFRRWFLWNAVCQLALFLPVVQIPAYLTGHMSYVDIGWPCGLMILGANSIALGTGFWLRRWLVGGCMLLHGSRMALGALVLFFPYRWSQDLPRYRYAKLRFEVQDGMPPGLWSMKVQHDTLQQAFANAVVLACPVMLSSFNKTPEISSMEVMGLLLYGVSWIFENIADIQKQLFLFECKKQQTNDAVLGYTPFDDARYWTWRLCRHPNYFGEWMAWNAFVVLALPSLLSLHEPLLVKTGFALTLFFTSRIFYDCLLYWTGAEPAEHFSLQRRPLYRSYQKSTRVFFPVTLPWFNHQREPGWPHLKGPLLSGNSPAAAQASSNCAGEGSVSRS